MGSNSSILILVIAVIFATVCVRYFISQFSDENKSENIDSTKKPKSSNWDGVKKIGRYAVLCVFLLCVLPFLLVGTLLVANSATKKMGFADETRGVPSKDQVWQKVSLPEGSILGPIPVGRYRAFDVEASKGCYITVFFIGDHQGITYKMNSYTEPPVSVSSGSNRIESFSITAPKGDGDISVAYTVYNP